MLSKTSRPEAREHRPTALTSVGYKLFMSLLKDKMVMQEMNDHRVKALQSGYMKGRRLEENLFILSQIVEECYAEKKQLYVIAIDFRKAFDSVDREALVKVLMHFQCDPRLIDAVVNLYQGDKTVIHREGRYVGETEVNCGTRQGCTGSLQIFLMEVSMIVEQLIRSNMGIESG